jgi:hypothetical protein
MDSSTICRHTLTDLPQFELLPETGIWQVCTNYDGVMMKDDSHKRSNKSVLRPYH